VTRKFAAMVNAWLRQPPAAQISVAYVLKCEKLAATACQLLPHHYAFRIFVLVSVGNTAAMNLAASVLRSMGVASKAIVNRVDQLCAN
jgi:hypothetical protein